MNESMREIDRVESALKSLPKIYDQRSDQAVFLRLNEAMDSQTKKQNQFRYILVSAVTIMIFTLLTSVIFLENRFDVKQSTVSQKDEMKVQETALRDKDYTDSNYTVSSQNKVSKLPLHDELFGSVTKYADISAALNSIRQVEASSGDPVPYIASTDSVQFEKIEEHNGQLLLTFTDDTVLENNRQYEMLISEILVTAEDFDFQTVRFQNSDVDVVGSYDLKGAIAVPDTPERDISE
ncbi:hypothetical protein IEO70_18675 [Bacillus sp. AGMB 02131]|uniref:GerMN domain-containing protein n=1 Tax=Peribacillus faecalis TaxID=2772559 RepID=A0A927CZ42_9BACI|nr:hypothetical protein [Peribacillus faecalis]MBD3110353.1 hypothetical protein [Peribacillus faecalis]